MRASFALVLAPVLISASICISASAAWAQGGAPGFGDLNSQDSGRPGARAGGQDAQSKADRRAILFLASHVKSLDAAIAEQRKTQQEMLEEAKRQEEEARRRAAEAERRRKEANSRAAGNALLILTGADPKDINTYNRIMDVHDVLAASTPEARKAASQKTYAPTALLLLGADVQSVNDLDTFSSAFGAISASSQAKSMKQQLELARRTSQQVNYRAMSLDESIKAMDAERARAMDLLQGYSKRYLAAVNDTVGAVPGFHDTFGSVKDIAFDFSLPGESADPLIQALTFQVRGDLVDVRLADIDQFLADHFGKLIATREAAVAEVQSALGRKQGEATALKQKKTDLQGQIRAKELEKAGLPGVRNLFARNRIDGEIAKLKGQLPNAEAESALQGALAVRGTELKKAQALVERAKAARDMLGKIDESKAKAALAQVRAML